MEMKQYKVKDVVSRVIDNRGRNADYFENEKYPIIDNYMIKNMLHPDLNTATRFLSEEQFQNFLRGYIKENDLLITLVGGIGNVSLAPHSTCAIVQNTIGLTFKEENCDSHYAYYYFKTIQYAIRNLNRGISQPSVNREDVLGLKLWLPMIGCQRRIAQVLLAYDNLIEVNNKRIKVLEQMAENLYKEWFVRFRFPGHETAEFENGIPKGWEYRKLNTMLDVRYGKDHKSLDDGNIPVFGSGGIMRFGNKALFTGEVVLIPRKGTLNNIMYYNGSLWTVDTMFYSVPTIDNFAKYAYYTLASIDMESYNSGAALPSMTTDILYHFRLLVPDKSTLEAFDEFVSGVFEQREALKKVNEKLIAQRNLLLPRLMSGKLEV